MSKSTVKEYLLKSLTNRRKAHPRHNLKNLQRFRLPKMLKQIRSKEHRKNLKVKLNSKNPTNKKWLNLSNSSK